MGRGEGLFLSVRMASRFGVAWLPFPFRRCVEAYRPSDRGYLLSATTIGIHEWLAIEKKNDAPPVLSMGGASFHPVFRYAGRAAYPYTKSYGLFSSMTKRRARAMRWKFSASSMSAAASMSATV